MNAVRSAVIVDKIRHVIARRSRSNLTIFQDNDGEIAALPLVARNDGSEGTPSLWARRQAKHEQRGLRRGAIYCARIELRR
ncbi:MAG: hypothetical protein C3F12_05770 [Candidatus Methylomirabilota bacterium]|nr:hypothetical protein [candidate division NC10 bacterium]PWB47474.1 MAG: hypothetical protein C3F12_05770 [candidate division NC10 bacterium]